MFKSQTKQENERDSFPASEKTKFESLAGLHEIHSTHLRVDLIKLLDIVRGRPSQKSQKWLPPPQAIWVITNYNGIILTHIKFPFQTIARPCNNNELGSGKFTQNF